ncbi:kelch-like protein 10 [Plakobranchus ocellatus]|uniref:Kelch-like protein 10 n=1 Tax=Plakobranchus ocellatus TaxID=259542 RepID=A0AAV4BR44_9GAST|nr:kelch-like protein 10 [Plakobranchus ocellatus]
MSADFVLPLPSSLLSSTFNWLIQTAAFHRCYVSVALLEGFIYAMGGFDGHVRQNSVERFTKETNQWSMIRPMHHQRSDASATTLNGKALGEVEQQQKINK